MRIEEDLKLGFKDVLASALNAPLLKPPMLNWNVNSPSNIQVRAGPASRFTQIWDTVAYIFSMASALASFDV